MIALLPLLLAAATPATAPDPLAAKTIEQLKAGEYLWAPQIAPEGPVMLIVSLGAQRAYVYRNGVPIGVTTISSGKDGHATPTGIFTILQKDVDHKSNLYSDAPMPFMQRLTWDGIALHAGKLPGYRASHGCVRLPLAFAKTLFAITKVGLTVVVTDRVAVPEVAPQGALLDPVADGHRDPRNFRWAPERSPTGPISILVSGRDRRVVVLRNGVEIGSSEIRLDAPVTTTAAFTLRAIDGEGAHWLRLPLPGQPSPGAAELSREEQGQGHLPEGFRRAVESVLTPGATMLVTREGVPSTGTGARLKVLEADDR